MFILFFVYRSYKDVKWIRILIIVLGIFSLIFQWYQTSYATKAFGYFSFCKIFLSLNFFCTLNYQEVIRKPSIEKLKILAEIQGLRIYLSAAEEHLLKFHNPPEKTPQIFEKYLPYVIVLVLKKCGENNSSAFFIMLTG